MGKRDADRNNRLMHEALAHADALYNFACHLSHNPVEAEDLVQETYARALGKSDQFQDGGNLKAWLYRILRNTFIDVYRRDQRLPTDDVLETVADAAPPRQEREVMGRELEA